MTERDPPEVVDIRAGEGPTERANTILGKRGYQRLRLAGLIAGADVTVG